MDYKIKPLASTFNNVSNTKLFTVVLNIPDNLLSFLLEIKDFNIKKQNIRREFIIRSIIKFNLFS